MKEQNKVIKGKYKNEMDRPDDRKFDHGCQLLFL